ncbi:MAG: 1-deoxy-D-xylulose-5-phosphate reductoisomerase [Treponema sp.]|nr:1-deoxy-D-xylulose-5-phosphate reductoisomerase [Treponema sp.]
MKKVLVLGCTGSIGTSALDIISNEKDLFISCGITAHSNKDKLEELASKFNCPSLLTKNASEKDYKNFIENCKPDIVVNGIAGSAGLMPSKVVLELGIDLALANKETVVMAYPLVKALSEKTGAKIIPVDSEHSAIFCLINQAGIENVDRILITASGGPFRTFTKEQLKNVTLEMALNHPTWKMGPKITIDSSTLANKGLEVIEASYLFSKSADKIDVIVHPQSIVHSMVRTNDGMIYGQLSDPDMKHPIIGALTYPENVKNYLKPFDLFDKELTFYRPRIEDFPLLGYAFDSVRKKGCYPLVFNAANEIAVHAFLEKKIGYCDIAGITEKTLSYNWSETPATFERVFELDAKAREIAKKLVENLTGGAR